MNKKIIILLVSILFVQAICVGVFSYNSYKKVLDDEKKFKESVRLLGKYNNSEKVFANNKVEGVEENTPNDISEDMGKLEDMEYLKNNIVDVEGRKNVLLVGVDSRGNDFSGRSDTILLLSLSKKGSYLISIPRDSYVYIKKKNKYDKINHSYAYGGIESLKQAVSDLLGVRIDNYAVINFYNFIDLIDSVGGVEVDIPFDFKEQGVHGETIVFHKGKAVLNGDQALAYVRMRKSDSRGDIGRNDRQKQVLYAFTKKVLSLEGVKNIPTLYDKYKALVRSDIKVIDIPKYLGFLNELNNIKSVTLQGEGVKIKGVYYMKLNSNELKHVIDLLSK